MFGGAEEVSLLGSMVLTTEGRRCLLEEESFSIFLLFVNSEIFLNLTNKSYILS